MGKVLEDKLMEYMVKGLLLDRMILTRSCYLILTAGQ